MLGETSRKCWITDGSPSRLAMWKQFQPSLFFSNGFAPCCRRSWITSRFLLVQAIIRGVLGMGRREEHGRELTSFDVGWKTLSYFQQPSSTTLEPALHSVQKHILNPDAPGNAMVSKMSFWCQTRHEDCRYTSFSLSILFKYKAGSVTMGVLPEQTLG